MKRTSFPLMPACSNKTMINIRHHKKGNTSGITRTFPYKRHQVGGLPGKHSMRTTKTGGCQRHTSKCAIKILKALFREIQQGKAYSRRTLLPSHMLIHTSVNEPIHTQLDSLWQQTIFAILLFQPLPLGFIRIITETQKYKWASLNEYSL